MIKKQIFLKQSMMEIKEEMNENDSPKNDIDNPFFVLQHRRICFDDCIYHRKFIMQKINMQQTLLLGNF